MARRRAKDAPDGPRDKRRLRRTVQLVVLALFLVVLANASTPMKFPLPVDAFVQLSPLNALTSSVAGRALVHAWWLGLIVLALTLPLGRYFCGWVCPLGTTLDVTDRILGRARRKQARELGRHLHHGKYLVLIVLVAFAIFSINLAGWFDPLSWVTRFYGLVVHPALYWLAGFIGLTRSGFLERYLFHPQSEPGTFSQPHFEYAVTIAAVFAAILLLGLMRKRFYCRVICPLGALFAVCTRLSPFRRKVSDACTECGRCVTGCKMGAIGPTGKGTRRGECILCLDCETVCPTAAIAFDPAYVKRTQMALVSKALPTDFTRRELLAALAGGVAAAPLFRLAFAAEEPATGEGVLANDPAARVIRPPGAVSDRAFLAACVRCGECMKVCPTNAIQPVLFQQGLESVWTPMIVPRVGYCEYQGDCRLCLQACPTRALGDLTVEDKKRFVLGKARVDRNKCIPWRSWSIHGDGATWSDEYNCGVCEEHCPSRSVADAGKAIRYDDVPGPEGRVFRRIYVEQDVCVGCGHCEHVCPIEGESAIRVTRTAKRGPSDKISGDVQKL